MGFNVGLKKIFQDDSENVIGLGGGVGIEAGIQTLFDDVPNDVSNLGKIGG